MRLHELWNAAEKLEYPVDVVRSPVVPGAAGDRGVRVPRPTGMREAADEGLDVEDLAEEPGTDRTSHRHEVGIPAPVLVNRQHALVRGRGRDDLIGLGDGQKERLR